MKNSLFIFDCYYYYYYYYCIHSQLIVYDEIQLIINNNNIKTFIITRNDDYDYESSKFINIFKKNKIKGIFDLFCVFITYEIKNSGFFSFFLSFSISFYFNFIFFFCILLLLLLK